jgi:hypothetical protein
MKARTYRDREDTENPSSSITPVKEKISSRNRYAPLADLSDQEEEEDHLVRTGGRGGVNFGPTSESSPGGRVGRV